MHCLQQPPPELRARGELVDDISEGFKVEDGHELPEPLEIHGPRSATAQRLPRDVQEFPGAIVGPLSCLPPPGNAKCYGRTVSVRVEIRDIIEGLNDSLGPVIWLLLFRRDLYNDSGRRLGIIRFA